MINFGTPRLMDICYGIEMDTGLYIIGGRPSSGKTVLLNEIAVNAASMGIDVAYFSLETSSQKIVRRFILSRAGIDGNKFRYRNWSSEDEHNTAIEKLASAAGEIYELGSHIMLRDVRVSITELTASARRLILQGIGLVLVDYLQIVGTKNRENRNVELQDVTSALCSLTQDAHIPVVAAAQLNRYIGLPDMKALREGGSQEAEAYKVILLHRMEGESIENEESNPNERKTLLRVAKHKDGPIGDAITVFHSDIMRFYDYEERFGVDYEHPFSYPQERSK